MTKDSPRAYSIPVALTDVCHCVRETQSWKKKRK